MKLPASDNPPPCQWFDQQVNPKLDAAHECGAPAQYKVKVFGAHTKAFVFLCEDHQAEVNRRFAAQRKQETQAG